MNRNDHETAYQDAMRIAEQYTKALEGEVRNKTPDQRKIDDYKRIIDDAKAAACTIKEGLDNGRYD